MESITIDGRSFAVTADADTSRKLGGFENEVQSNGDGTARTVKTRVPWSLTGVVIEIDDTAGDQEFLQSLQNSNRNVPITATYVSGVSYQATGQVVGEVVFSNQSSSASLDLSGSGEMTPQ
ncbi:MAG: hypothetical protein CMF72_22545 [Mameliella sp.]|nr:hypothetical protein [Mameliella sp.]|tara:strand:+ start:4382 stop:4744 length:363 start_codon:yes stop_codon:yes gene_type:complete